jgi:hypothetical protein
MPETITNYIIEPSPNAVSHPRIYKVTSISEVEISRTEPTFKEVSLAEPELFSEFLTQFKDYISGFASSIDELAGVDALIQETLISFEKGIIYAANQARSIED